jgi:hypothetical protein
MTGNAVKVEYSTGNAVIVEYPTLAVGENDKRYGPWSCVAGQEEEKGVLRG